MPIDPAAANYAATTPPAKGKPDTAEIDKEAAWKGEFRQTLNEVRDMGFSAYAEKIRVEKLAEMREEILKAMGLNEESLAELSADQRAIIERAVNQEIQKRLAAERTLEQDDPIRAAAVDGVGAPVGQPLTTPNTGPGLILLQIIETADQARSEHELDDKTS
jgi:hypothetical protein